MLLAYNFRFIEFVMLLKFIKLTKNKKQLYHDGYLYHEKSK